MAPTLAALQTPLAPDEAARFTGPDTIEGTLRVCSLRTGTCEAPVEVPGLRDLALPGVDSFLG